MGNDALKWGREQRDGTGINNVCGKEGSLKNDPKVPKNPPCGFHSSARWDYLLFLLVETVQLASPPRVKPFVKLKYSLRKIPQGTHEWGQVRMIGAKEMVIVLRTKWGEGGERLRMNTCFPFNVNPAQWAFLKGFICLLVCSKEFGEKLSVGR